MLGTLLCLWLAHPVSHPNIADSFIPLMSLIVGGGVDSIPRENLICHVINSSFFGLCLLMVVKDGIKVDLYCIVESFSDILTGVPTRT